MYPVRLIGVNPVSNNCLLLPGCIQYSRHFGIHIAFVDKETPQLIRRLVYQRSIEDNRRFADTAKLFTKPSFLVSSRPVVDEKLPFHQSEHLKVGLLPEIRLQLIRFIGFIIGDDYHFIQQIFSVTDIFRRTAGGQHPNKA